MKESRKNRHVKLWREAKIDLRDLEVVCIKETNETVRMTITQLECI